MATRIARFTASQKDMLSFDDMEVWMNRCVAAVEHWGNGCTVVCTQFLEKSNTFLVTYRARHGEPTPEKW
jgi:hypothetical protein